MVSGRSNPLGIIGALATILLAPLAALIIQLAISRSRELQADRTAAQRTGDPLALASALQALERGNRAVPSPTASLFSTHPPIEERVRRLDEMAHRGPALA